MAQLKLTFWGNRGSCPGFDNKSLFYGGNTTCLSIELDKDHLIILDAGTGIRKCGQHFKNSKKKMLFMLTHLHWDHIQGFPFFLPIYEKRNIDFFSACGKKSLSYLLKQLDGIAHPLKATQLPSTITYLTKKQLYQTYPFTCDFFQTRHPGSCYAYSLQFGSKKVVFMPDNQLHEGNYQRLDYTKLFQFCSEADMLIHDAQYTKKDMPQKKDWGHSIIDDTVKLALKAKVKQLYLVHHDPGRTDNQINNLVLNVKKTIQKKGSSMHCQAAYDGMEVFL